MDNYETRTVIACGDCPFYQDENLVCLHPKNKSTLSELAGHSSHTENPPPEWCPLRKAALLIDLRVVQR